MLITVTVNGVEYTREVEPRMQAADFLRDELQLTGTHVGCEQGVCGSCTIIVNGQTARSCIMFAPQLDGADVLTVEGLADGSAMHPIQEAFRDCHGLQCGFCTPGFLLAVHELLSEVSSPADDEIREALSGNLCRCTGYEGIVEAVKLADVRWVR
ncbi:MAG: carbon monoxide dehydrogenase small chain [Blastococcus sp.]|jgi:aerobic-type carbon monoxide dehydrogenase small subunit (CoxS/CutS family)|nr:carbon monoxide dehydrogenase small chain [Blastococcus sp.]